jgi:hypothetical protein
LFIGLSSSLFGCETVKKVFFFWAFFIDMMEVFCCEGCLAVFSLLCMI